MEEKNIATNQGDIVCKNCGSKLTFAPGLDSLKCQNCGTVNEIKMKDEVIEEIDFLSFINKQKDTAPMQQVTTIKCNSCGAETTFEPNVVSQSCAFCASPLVVSSGSTHSVIQPKSVLPFKVTDKEGTDLFQKWLKGLWFAPNDLKKYARQKGKLAGMYLPYWTYDADARTHYSGERGDNYEEEESYTNDKGESDTRTVTKTAWTSVSGHVRDVFDDVLVVASKSLPESYVDKLEPWDLNNLAPFDPQYITGFKTESYQVDVKDGFETAKVKMEEVIRGTIRKDIGGDQQRIHSMQTQYDDITFKHILLPIWLSAYRYNDKVYRFMINARTGEVQGERPWSWIKVTLAILALIAVIVALVLIFGGKKH
jgi:LSD1 subclass zinc finger protein